MEVHLRNRAWIERLLVRPADRQRGFRGRRVFGSFRSTGRSIARAAVYITLRRLEEKGFVSSWMGEPTPERGGKARRHVKLEPKGAKALPSCLRRAGGILEHRQELKLGSSGNSGERGTLGRPLTPLCLGARVLRNRWKRK